MVFLALPNGAVTAPENAWIRTLYELPFLLFNLVVFWFILCRCYQKVYPYNSAFYIFYIAYSIAIYAGYVNALSSRYLNVFGDCTYFGCQAIFRFITFHFAVFFTFFADCGVALNRFTAINLPLKHLRIWSNKRLAIYMIISMIISLSCASFKPIASLFMNTNYTSAYIAADTPHIIIAAFLGSSTSLVSIVAQAFAFIAFYQFTAAQRRINLDNFRLLIYAVSVQVLQIDTIVYFVAIAFNWPSVYEVADSYLTYFRYVQWFLNAACLFLTNRSVRADFFVFYKLRKFSSNRVLVVSSTETGNTPRIDLC